MLADDNKKDILLRLKDVTKDYPLGEITVHALKGVSFEVFEKELIVIDRVDSKGIYEGAAVR